MNNIEFHQVIPDVFAEKGTASNSDVWGCEQTLTRGNTYLIEAVSGTGKSSLCSFVYGWRTDYKGLICFDGKDIRRLSMEQWTDIRRHSISLMFQELRLFEELTAWENVWIKNALTNFKPRQEIHSWFERFGLDDKRDTLVSHLSFGQQQRIALMRALCQPFHFLFLDEPVSHLDEANGRTMAALLTEEAGRQGAGIVVTSIGRHLMLDYIQTLKL